MATVSIVTPFEDAAATEPRAPFLVPAGDILYEVVDDAIRELPAMVAREAHLASTLSRILGSFTWNSSLGHVVIEMLFLLDRARNLQRRPDVAFVSFERWARARPVPAEPAWNVVPNLAIEIVSPTTLANEIIEMIEDYFSSGVERVWVFYPSVAKVYDYESPGSVRILAPGEVLSDSAMFPGLEIPVTDLFPSGVPK
ncbi:MAG TPA: Uma2 family endonuclease, partial [Isosphaeraceae bacterium]|nr:Uma2 family endonuclease [Isosphaeraceae bacterium]